jgi:micrococcal nuclease
VFSFLRRLFGLKPRTEKPGVQSLPEHIERPAESQQAPADTQVKLSLEHLKSAKVLHVLDGDTVEVLLNRVRVRVRLASIDCPEDGQDWGYTATAGLIKLIGGRTISLEEHGHDHHGRLLATLYLRRSEVEEWLNVNERMVMLGHAWVMRHYYHHLPPDRRSKLNKIEKWARSKRVGLWGTPDPKPPWKWRSHTRASDERPSA